MIFEGKLRKPIIISRGSKLFVLFVVISFFHYLNKELGLAVFANELFVVSRIKFSGAQRAERDLTHDVLNTRMNF